MFKSSIHNCRSLDEAAAAMAVSTPPVRNLRLLLEDDDEEEEDFGEVETKTIYLERSLLVCLGLNSIAEGPERPAICS